MLYFVIDVNCILSWITKLRFRVCCEIETLEGHLPESTLGNNISRGKYNNLT